MISLGSARGGAASHMYAQGARGAARTPNIGDLVALLLHWLRQVAQAPPPAIALALRLADGPEALGLLVAEIFLEVHAGRPGAALAAQHEHADVVALYWHFVDAVWLVVFLVVYVVGR